MQRKTGSERIGERGVGQREGFTYIEVTTCKISFSSPKTCFCFSSMTSCVTCKYLVIEVVYDMYGCVVLLGAG